MFRLLKNKHTVLIILILALGLFLRVSLSSDQCVHKWDERFHALVSKNLLKHPLKPTLYETPLLKYNYKHWYANHIWLHKQPLPMWLIASSYSLFGCGTFQTRIPSLILSLFAIYVLFLLGRALFNEKVGLLAAFFLSINGLLIEMGSGRVATDHYDALYMVFILISIYFALKNSKSGNMLFSILSGVFIGIAILTKWLPCLIVIPIHFFLLKNERSDLKNSLKQISISMICAAVVSLPWQFYILKNYPLEANWEYHYNALHFTEVLDQQGGSAFYYVNKIRINYSEIVYAPLLCLIIQVATEKFSDAKKNALLFWILAPIVFFSMISTKMQGYIAFICPALFIVTANFFFEVKDKWLASSKKLVRGISILFLILIIALPIRYCFERTSFGFGKQKCDAYASIYKSFENQLSENCVVLNVKEPIDFMFYTNCVAYSNPNIMESDTKKIKALGYKIFFLSDDCRLLKQLN